MLCQTVGCTNKTPSSQILTDPSRSSQNSGLSSSHTPSNHLCKHTHDTSLSSITKYIIFFKRYLCSVLNSKPPNYMIYNANFFNQAAKHHNEEYRHCRINTVYKTIHNNLHSAAIYADITAFLMNGYIILLSWIKCKYCITSQHHPIPPSIAPATSAINDSGTSTYFPRITNHFPTGLSTPLLTDSSANFFPATQKNIIAASIAPRGQI